MSSSLHVFQLNHSASHLHDAWRHHRQDEVEPDVGEDAPEGGDEEHPEVFDLAGLIVGDDPHAEPDYHKHVEGGAANNGSRSQLTSPEVVPTHLGGGRVNVRFVTGEEQESSTGTELTICFVWNEEGNM